MTSEPTAIQFSVYSLLFMGIGHIHKINLLPGLDSQCDALLFENPRFSTASPALLHGKLPFSDLFPVLPVAHVASLMLPLYDKFRTADWLQFERYVQYSGLLELPSFGLVFSGDTMAA